MSDLLTIPRWLLDRQQKLDLGCASQCDCDGPDELLGIDHAPDCHSRTECDGDHTCDKHQAEAEADHAYLRGTPRHTVFNDAQAEQERNQELVDAGRSHLVRHV